MGKLSHHKKGIGCSNHVPARRHISQPSTARETTFSANSQKRVGCPSKKTFTGIPQVAEAESSNVNQSAMHMSLDCGQSSVTSLNTYVSLSLGDSSNKKEKVHEGNHSDKTTSQSLSSQVDISTSTPSTASSSNITSSRRMDQAKN